MLGQIQPYMFLECSLGLYFVSGLRIARVSGHGLFQFHVSYIPDKERTLFLHRGCFLKFCQIQLARVSGHGLFQFHVSYIPLTCKERLF